MSRGYRGLGLVGILVGMTFLAAWPARSAASECPNESLRIGASAGLPDCRAYELVSPSDSNGRELSNIRPELTYAMFPTEYLSPSRDGVIFMSVNTPLSDLPGTNGVEDLWEAARTPEGWKPTRLLSPSGTDYPAAPDLGGVSSDHRYALIHPNGSAEGGTLASEGSTDYLSKPNGFFELTGIGSLGSERRAQGRYISPGGAHVIFVTGGNWCNSVDDPCPIKQLEPDAPPTGTAAVYDRAADGPTRVISLLPGDVPPAAGEDATYQGASADGSVVAFAIGGTLYARVHNEKTEEVIGGSPTFGGLSHDGGALFYVSGGDIYRFDTATESTDQINSSGDAELVNVSADGSHAYFVSESQLDGVKGSAGQPNLYVWSVATATPRFVATVSPVDLTGFPALANWATQVVNPDKRGSEGPGANSSRSTPDGHVLVFESQAQLTSYANGGHREVYRYDDQDESLSCVSCNPAGSPTGDARLQAFPELGGVEYAGTVVVNNLTEDGSRIFFETTESLSSRDVDGINDIYEWEGNNVVSTVKLISSGQSTAYPLGAGEPPVKALRNVLLAVSADGSDVVFFSQDALVEGAGTGGVVAIYDARVEGGFPPRTVPVACKEESCRSEVGPEPGLPGPQSEADLGPQNFKPGKRCRRVRKARHGKKAKKRCARTHRKKHRASASSVSSSSHPTAQSESRSWQEPAGADSTPAGEASLTRTASSPLALGAEELEPFEINEASAEGSSNAAGLHPDVSVKLVFNHHLGESGQAVSQSKPKDISVVLPPGLIGDPTSFPPCSTGEFLQLGNCPVNSQVGVVKVLATNSGSPKPFTEPLFLLAPPHDDEIARLGFWGVTAPVYIDVSVRAADNYRVVATVAGAPSWVSPVSATTIIWGNPPDASHDKQRLTVFEGNKGCETACTAPGGKRASGLPPTAFLTNPTACEQQQVDIEATSYQFPGQLFMASAPMEPIAGCGEVPFDASLELEPTSHVAGAPTGLNATLHIPQVNSPEARSTSALKEAKVTLPEGMTISAPAAAGLETCSPAQVHLGEEVDAACPDASKLGTATVVSPDLPRPLEGTLYARTPEPGHIFRLWLTVDEMGVHAKLPAEIATDPTTGRITATFADAPQVPIEEVELNVWGGPRSALKNPDSCGTFGAPYEFSPWSGNQPVQGEAQVHIDQGCSLGFAPALRAGTTNPVAAAYSPLVFNLTTGEGQENLRSIDAEMPPGLLAKLAGVPLCSDALAQTGACPEESQIGSAKVSVGTGPRPFWLPEAGKPSIPVYLAGPYGSAPYSLVVKAAAQAGPFDLGTVVTRAGIDVEPETGRVKVHADLPRIVGGVPIYYRTLHLLIDRPDFVLNPTNCEPLSFTAAVTSSGGNVAQPSDRFQVGGCKRLGFHPRFKLQLRGGTKRGSYPALTATVHAKGREANFGRVSVALPHAEFLAQEHIRTICTRVQFAAEKCPKGSVYGHAEARTPLLDQPLKGPVYLRSSSHPLPDLVVALRGQIEIDLAGRIDSKDGGIRAVFESVPDAPVSFFKLKMKGGKASLLKNSTDICKRKHFANVDLLAQNGRSRLIRAALNPKC